jgi:hypothetical protein
MFGSDDASGSSDWVFASDSRTPFNLSGEPTSLKAIDKRGRVQAPQEEEEEEEPETAENPREQSDSAKTPGEPGLGIGS